METSLEILMEISPYLINIKSNIWLGFEISKFFYLDMIRCLKSHLKLI